MFVWVPKCVIFTMETLIMLTSTSCKLTSDGLKTPAADFAMIKNYLLLYIEYLDSNLNLYYLGI